MSKRGKELAQNIQNSDLELQRESWDILYEKCFLEGMNYPFPFKNRGEKNRTQQMFSLENIFLLSSSPLLLLLLAGNTIIKNKTYPRSLPCKHEMHAFDCLWTAILRKKN